MNGMYARRPLKQQDRTRDAATRRAVEDQRQQPRQQQHRHWQRDVRGQRDQATACQREQQNQQPTHPTAEF